jgi:hypothetical protein
MEFRARLDDKFVGRCVAIIVVALSLLSVASHVWRVRFDHGQPHLRTLWFDANWEHSIPTYYQGVSLLVVSLMLGMITLHARRTRSSLFLGWLVLCLGFLALSFDELCEVHEMVSYLTDKSMAPSGYFHFSWVIVGLLIVAVIALSYVWFLTRLPLNIARRFFIAGTIYVSGAIGMEMLSGKYLESYGEESLGYQLLSDAEETGEMTGIAIFLTALATYMGQQRVTVSLSFKPATAAEGTTEDKSQAPNALWVA